MIKEWLELQTFLEKERKDCENNRSEFSHLFNCAYYKVQEEMNRIKDNKFVQSLSEAGYF